MAPLPDQLAKTLDVPAEMLTQIAVGLEDPFTIATRFGFDFASWTKVQGSPWYVRALEAKRRDLDAQGFTFRAKMGMLAEDMLVNVYKEALVSTSLALKLDVAKYLTKVADLEPKVASQITPGERFSLKVVFSAQAKDGAHEITLEANETLPKYLDFENSPPPLYLLPDPTLNLELTGNIQDVLQPDRANSELAETGSIQSD